MDSPVNGQKSVASKTLSTQLNLLLNTDISVICELVAWHHYHRCTVRHIVRVVSCLVLRIHIVALTVASRRAQVGVPSGAELFGFTVTKMSFGSI